MNLRKFTFFLKYIMFLYFYFKVSNAGLSHVIKCTVVSSMLSGEVVLSLNLYINET